MNMTKGVPTKSDSLRSHIDQKTAKVMLPVLTVVHSSFLFNTLW